MSGRVIRNSLYVSAAAVLVAVLIARGLHFETPTEDAPVIQADNFVDAGAEFALDKFGIENDRFDAVDGRIKRNQTFSDLLKQIGIEYPVINELVNESEDKFDLRNWQAGKRYTLYSSGDTHRFLVYEHNSVDFVVFDLVEATVVRNSRPITITRKFARGSINGSLYQTLLDQQVDPTLAYELSEVFAWQVDFYRIQPGDEFEVIYDERRVGSRSIGVGRIHAARFTHMKDAYLAFHFDKEGDIAYFDEEGNSLQKAFLKAPVKYSRISSRYTGRRFHPVLKTYRAHLGTDYAAATGTEIRATGDGVIEVAGYTKYNGNWVKIRHNGTYSTGYLHMSRLAKGIRPGVHVRQGDLIGYVGSTGLARGSHVCYRFWKNGKQVDPSREKFPSAHPVSDENMDYFAEMRDQYIQELSELSDNYTAPSNDFQEVSFAP